MWFTPLYLIIFSFLTTLFSYNHLMKLLFFTLLLLFFSACTPQKTQPLHHLELHAHGVSKLNKTTPFTQADIASKLLGYGLRFFTAFEAGKAKKILEVSFYDEKILYITPSLSSTKEEQSTIASISIVNKLVKTPLNITIGQKYSEDLALKCKKHTNNLLCKDPKFPMLDLLFYLGTNKQYRLKEIIWRADALY